MAKRLCFLLLLALCAFPSINAALALVLGAAFAFLLGNPWPGATARASRVLLQLSVVGLGFALRLQEVASTGREYFIFTVAGIALTLLVGWRLGRLLRTEENTSLLISFGTAICGGSAIAALAPVLKAKDDEIAVSLATVFLLNAVALVAFPPVGHLLGLSQELFGAWAGLAIHDTSSVVGAASVYGPRALAVGATVKLTRAVWITPVVLGAAWAFGARGREKFPLFILGFLAAAGVRTLFPDLHAVWDGLAGVARQGLAVTLFLIGGGLTREALRRVGARPLALGVCLWALVSVLTLAALLTFGAA